MIMAVVIKFKLNKSCMLYCVIFYLLVLSSSLCFDRIDNDYTFDDQNTTTEIQPTLLASNCSREFEFTCDSGVCINATLLCDGIRDCTNGSDETYTVCKDMRCPKYTFQCKYGACIDIQLRCDGIENCIDGSDESFRLCKKYIITTVSKNTSSTKNKPSPKTTTPLIATTISSATETTIVKQPVPGSCALPLHSTDKSYSISKCGSFLPTDSCDLCPGEPVPPFTVLSFECQSGFKYDISDTHIAYCMRGLWLPPISNCTRVCDKLKPKNVLLKCERNDEQVDCAGDLLPGTEVTPTCVNMYTPESTYYYPKIKCDEHGHWDHGLFSCIPICGVPYTNVSTHIIGGQTAEYGSAPWHVAIYEVKEHILICGGTIISPYLILSAAHCFYDNTNGRFHDISNFEVIVSKVSRNYSIADNSFQKMFKLNKIYFPREGYHGLITYHSSDIALLVTSKKIIFSPVVLPACVQWHQDKQERIRNGSLGMVVGWGLTSDNENATGSEVLLSVNMPYINRANCLKIVVPEFIRYLTEDKFCAPTLSGTGIRQGDSGGGLIFQNKQNSFHYIQGVVSLKDSSETLVTLFTDIRAHMEWIFDVQRETEYEFGS